MTLPPVSTCRCLLFVSSLLSLLLVGCGVGSAPSDTSSGSSSGVLTANLTSVAFGSVNVGSSLSKPVTITNSGTASIDITNWVANGSYFSVSGVSIPATLSPSQSVVATVSFSPSASGQFSGSLAISTDTQERNISIPLTGTGVTTGAAQLNASPSTVSFGSVAVGSTSSQNVTVANVGSLSANINSASYSGAGFSLSGLSTPMSLSSGQASVFTVGFSPSSSGTANGSVVFKDNSGATLLTVPLTGTGVVPASHTVDLTWQASTSAVVGYRVYRGGVSGGPYSIITNQLVASTAFSDGTVLGGSTYYYVVTAVDSNNQESSFSNQVAATIPLP